MLQYWEGDNYSYTDNKVLILGESHYGSEYNYGQVLEKDETKKIVQYYLRLKSGEEHNSEKSNWTSFFSKIASSFGYGNRYAEFYGKVLFANYVDVHCGLKSYHASSYLEDNSYRIHCNDELFELINVKKVDSLFCFSKRVYDNLPSLEKDKEKAETDIISLESSKSTQQVNRCNYRSGIGHDYCRVSLLKDIEVFCFRHPAAGLSTTRAAEYIKKLGVLQ